MRRLGAAVLLVVACLMVCGCQQSTADTEELGTYGLVGSRVDRVEARDYADMLVDRLIADDVSAIAERSEFGDSDPEVFVTALGGHFDEIGQPLQAEFVWSQDHVDAVDGDALAPSIRHWYALRTTESEPGGHFLIVDVVSTSDELSWSTFTVVRRNEVPNDILKSATRAEPAD